MGMRSGVLGSSVDLMECSRLQFTTEIGVVFFWPATALARSRFSIAANSKGFVFASELSALARHPEVATRLSRRALQKYFAYGYIPAPLSLFEGSSKLPGGCYLTYDVTSGKAEVQRYWAFRIQPDESLSVRDEDRLCEELRSLLISATRRRLVSDVPLRVILSGGIDSSAVLASAASSMVSTNVRTFTVGFKEPSFDESKYARDVAKYFKTQHTEETLELESARDLISSVLKKLDEPLADSSILPTYLLSKFTRQHVTVALSGDGGDEPFAAFKALSPAQIYYNLVPRGLHKGLRRLAELIPRIAE